MSTEVIKKKCLFREMELEDIAANLKNGMNAEEVHRDITSYKEMRILHILFEKFYFRTSSYAALDILVTDDQIEQTACIIGFGGGQGLFNISYGANASFARDAESILKDCGFIDPYE
ncbi:MAG: hypothetical protein IKD69_11185 [Solobacterium sp.]|nr:hypothetical protein [Solobacterium sp.]